MRRIPPLSLTSALDEIQDLADSGPGRLSLAAHLGALAARAHPAVALDLAPFALSYDRDLAEVAAETVQRVLPSLDADAILWLAREGRFRHLQREGSHGDWQSLVAADVPRLERFGPASTSLLCLASVHASGYVRQACVERLARAPGSQAFAFLLLRLNDWVRPVRAAARLAIVGRLLEARDGDLSRARELLENLLLVERLSTWGRDDFGPIHEAIAATIDSPAFGPVLAQGLYHCGGALLGHVFRLALQRSAHAPASTLLDALAAREPQIRIWAAREAVRRLSGEDLRRAITRMRGDRLGIVRQEATFALATKLSPPDQDALRELLLDPSPNVRFLACHYLQECGFDPRAFYLGALAEPGGRDLAILVAGLGERGKPGDEAHLMPLLAHPQPEVRGAALRALAKLSPEFPLNTILAALRDPHKAVAREAVHCLEKRMHLVGEETLAAWLSAEPRRFFKRQAIRLGGRLERWTALAFLLDAAQAPDPAVRVEVRRELARLLRRSSIWYTPPNPTLLGRLERALLAARAPIGEQLFPQMNAILAFMRKRSSA